jgi:antitoxin (DNA-binding transcriptional repressor) of toxin-antitoxin stability system
MPTLPLRDLLRQPSKVKRLTRAGHVVRITDRGVPLWDLQPVHVPEQDQSDAELRRAADEIFADLLAEKPLPTHPGSVPISEVVIKSRR